MLRYLRGSIWPFPGSSSIKASGGPRQKRMCEARRIYRYGWHFDTTSENSQISGSNPQRHSNLEQPHRQGVRKVRPKSQGSTEVEKNISLPRTSPHLCWRGTAHMHHGVCLPCVERRTSIQADSPSRIVLPT